MCLSSLYKWTSVCLSSLYKWTSVCLSSQHKWASVCLSSLYKGTNVCVCLYAKCKFSHEYYALLFAKECYIYPLLIPASKLQFTVSI